MNSETKPDFAEITENQKITWATGDFNQIARLNVGMSEVLCSEVDPQPGQSVLDIACGSGTAALIVERRFCEVTGIDFVPGLIRRAKMRAKANGQKVEFLVGDAQKLPFPDASFDVVMSVYGVQFAPDHEKAASEMLRVCKPGGKIALAGPIPEGWSGDFFSTHGKYMPPPPGAKSPLRWGTNAGLAELLGNGCTSIKSKKKKALQYYLSTDHAVEIFRRWFGPTLQAAKMLNDKEQENLYIDLKEVFNRYNRAKNGTAIVENVYLQTIAIRNLQ